MIKCALLWLFMVQIKKTPEFDSWLSELAVKEQAQVEARLYRIEAYDHFGDCERLEGTASGLIELRWANGWHVYFYRDGKTSIQLLVGGKKNDQKKDIKKAEILFRRYARHEK
jgi:putative addiction module killer protein